MSETAPVTAGQKAPRASAPWGRAGRAWM